jgi:hypothetical protein
MLQAPSQALVVRVGLVLIKRIKRKMSRITIRKGESMRGQLLAFNMFHW